MARWVLRLAVCALPALAPIAAGASGVYRSSIQALSAAERARMTGQSWHAGCPVSLDDLVAVHLDYVGFDNAVHEGVLVVHRRVASQVVTIFAALFQDGFEIERMQPYDDFPVGKYAASNDTVGFYCRPAQDDPGSFSWHAYGLAVDINPLINPYHDPKEGWWPAGSSVNADRDRTAPGLISKGSVAVKIFLDHGWMWGGFDPRDPDYMHFAKVTVGAQSNPVDRPVWADRLVFAPK